MLKGKCRVTALDSEGGNYIGDVEEGDLWYFPSGHPHSLQGLSEEGCEFLLIFDDGHFSEDSTFLLSDWVGMLCRITSWRARLTHLQPIRPALFFPRTFSYLRRSSPMFLPPRNTFSPDPFQALSRMKLPKSLVSRSRSSNLRIRCLPRSHCDFLQVRCELRTPPILRFRPQ